MDSAGALPSLKPVSARQFALFRIFLGAYLLVHFLHLLPYGPELFSSQGAFPDPALSPLYGLFPNWLAAWDSPPQVRAFLGVLAALSLLFTLGLARRACALLLWYGWTCLFNRDPLISNPGLPYVGLVLLLSALVPPGEGFSPGRPRPDPGWAFPRQAYNAAFFLLMLGYSFSGLAKLSSPSWINGEALLHLADNPLARPWILRDLVKAAPLPLLQLATWGALAAEILALPLSLSFRLRPWVWLALLGMHLGILGLISFADLTFGMVMLHLFTLDPEWFPARAGQGRKVVYFDGVCALCDGFVGFLLEEDRGRVLKFAPLQGAEAERELAGRGGPGLSGLKSVVYSRDGRLLTRSSAILAVLDDIGGFWRALAWPLRLVPAFLRNWIYDLIAALRYRIFGRYEACRMPRPGEKERMLD